MSIVSIIVPVYNVEKYLDECLHSISKQTFTSFEVIMIDDGSTDNSSKICKNYVSNDKRFHYYYQKNSGLSCARNKGLTLSTSDYIYFLDSDDFIESNTLEVLVKIAMRTKADVVVHNINQHYPDGIEKKKIWSIPGDRLLEIDELKEQILIAPCYAVNKLYSKSFLSKNKINFVPNICYEDVPFFVEFFLNNPKVYYTEKYLYNYRVSRPGSITTQKNLRSLDILKVSKIVKGLLKSRRYESFWIENFKVWQVWNFAWMYVKLPNAFHSFIIWLLYVRYRCIFSEVLDVLGMRIDIVKILGVPVVFYKYHSEKTTALLFGLIPLYLKRDY